MQKIPKIQILKKKEKQRNHLPQTPAVCSVVFVFMGISYASSGVRDLMEMVLVIPLHGSTLCSHPDSET